MSPNNHPKQVLSQRGLGPKKSFGQNFLTNESYLTAIATSVASLCQHGELVVEYGAGLGALTDYLLKQNLPVHAIERDRDLIAPLNERFAEAIAHQSFTLHEANAATFDVLELSEGKKFVLCGNLPYQLTSTLLFRAMEYFDHLSGAVFMIQKEVADRIVAKPHSKTYGLLSVLLQARFHVSIVCNVPRGAFWPVPNVDSAVIKLVPKEGLPALDWKLLEQIAKASFAQRRKTLRNSLGRFDDVQRRMKDAGIDENLRAENLSPQDFMRLVQCW